VKFQAVVWPGVCIALALFGLNMVGDALRDMLDRRVRARGADGMKVPFAQKLDAGEFAVALEITPPQRHMPRVLLRRAGLLGGAAQAINVIQRPGRQSSLDASLELKAAGIEPAWHLVTRGRSRADIASDLERAATGGIGQVLCILGDHAASDTPDTPTIREAIALTRTALPGAIVGATLNQYGPDEAAVLKNLVPKLRAGASYVQTQPVFDMGTLERFATAIEREAPETAVVAMAMPLLSLEAALRIEERLAIALPRALKEVLAGGDLEAAWGAFAATIRSLADSALVDGVAIMTFEMDPPREMGDRILASLRAAGVA
jgi:methylenetetrahydrofolate reductase (NADPH)